MEFDGEAFGAEIVAAVKSYVGKEFVPVMVQIEKLSAEIKTVSQEVIVPWAPDDIVDEIAKAIALLAEAPALTQATCNPVVVNFSPPNTAKKIKTITTRRDEAGNLVARVIED